MRKTFFKVSLFTLLTAAMSVGFVGCKDYDDDIDNINKEIADIKTKLTELENKIKSGSVITGVDKTNDGIVITLSDGSTWPITNGKDGENGTNGTPGTVVTIDSEGYWCLDGTRTQYKAKGENGTNGKNGEYWAPNEAGTELVKHVWDPSINDYKATNDKVAITVKGKDGIVAIDNGEDVTLYGVKGTEGPIRIAKSGALRSIVFQPDFYYGGIEALSVNTYKFDAKDVEAVNANDDFSTDKPVSAGAFTTAPLFAAKYAVNPSSATMPKDVKAYKFVVNDLEYVSRATGFNPTITAVSTQNGILTVSAKANGSIQKLADDSVTVMALKVSLANDTAVSSDYAAVREVAKEGFILACPTAEYTTGETHNHWFATAADAIACDSIDALKVKYDSTIDLAKYVETHFINPDEVWANSVATKNTVNGYGFKYGYELVGYMSGDNKTSQSAHAALNGSILRPQTTLNGKQQAYGVGEQNRSIIGRQPIVRVTLTDTVNNKIAAVGYMKLVIAPTTQGSHNYKYKFDFDSIYTVSCSDPKPLAITWHQFEETILGDLDLERSEFEDRYTIDKNAAGNIIQYKDTTGLLRNPEFGKIEYDVDKEQTQGDLTSVIKWSIKSQEAYQQFKKATPQQTSVSTIIRFTENTTSANPSHIYVTLTWEPKEINNDPTVTLAGQIQEFWFKSWTAENTAFDEIHANVRVPRNTSETASACTFINKFGSYWQGDAPAMTGLASVYTDFVQSKLKMTYTFVTPDPTPVTGISGTKYDLFVKEDTILCAKVNGTLTPDSVVAIITNNATTVGAAATKDAIVTYAENAFAKDVLNYKGAQQLNKGETLTAKIAVVAENECGLPITIANSKYNVRFLRPISLSAEENDGLTDGLTSGDDIDLAELIGFYDWRCNSSTSKVGGFKENPFLFNYYGVKSIKVGKFENGQVKYPTSNDITEFATTTLGKGGILAEVNSNIELSFIPATTISNTTMGTIKYLNNGTVLGEEYTITIPFVVEYKWGYIQQNVTVAIHPTVGQN